MGTPHTRKAVVLLVGLMLAGTLGVCWPQRGLAAGVPICPVYQATDPMTAALAPTGPDLTWTTVKEEGNTRLFLSDHSETIGANWPKNPGRLWVDEAAGADEISYRIFVSHINLFPRPIIIGLLVENLSADAAITANGQAVTYITKESTWAEYRRLGTQNAYAELSGIGMTPLTAQTIPAGDGTARTLLLWTIPSVQTLGARANLTIRRAAGEGPLRCRLYTAWGWSAAELAKPLPLIPAQLHHPRGSWATSEVRINNSGDPFDLAKIEEGRAAVRTIRISQPDFAPDGKKSYRHDVVYTSARSFNPTQALNNNGSYGAHVHTDLHITNSGKTDETVEFFLRYPDKRLEGCYVGAVMTYAYDEEQRRWQPADTRAVQLCRQSYPDGTNDDFYYTKAIARYPIKAGETRVIPLTFTTDFPAMLPLGITMRKAEK